MDNKKAKPALCNPMEIHIEGNLQHNRYDWQKGKGTDNVEYFCRYIPKIGGLVFVDLPCVPSTCLSWCLLASLPPRYISSISTVPMRAKLANMSEYNVVFVGFPIWWYTCPIFHLRWRRCPSLCWIFLFAWLKNFNCLTLGDVLVWRTFFDAVEIQRGTFLDARNCK